MGPEAEAGKTAQHSLLITEGEPDSATIEGRFGSHQLAARFMRDPEGSSAFGVQLDGTVQSPMPNKTEMDDCIAAGRAGNPVLFGEGDMDDYLAQGCRQNVSFAEAPATIEMLISIEGDTISNVFVERRYEGDDQRGGTLYGIASFTEWNCALVR